MDSANSSFSIPTQETLLLHNTQHQKPSLSRKLRIKNIKAIIFFVFLILLILIIVGTFTLSSIFKKKQKPDAYNSGSSRYYCNLTPYPHLCYTSMSSIINATALKPDPGPIFTAALQVAINQLNSTAISIAKALSSPTKNTPLLGPRLLECQKLVHDSLSRLNKSLELLGVDSDVESLTYMEMDEFRDWTMGATDSAGKCLLSLEEIEGMMMAVGGEEGKMGMEEVKMGVEKANNLIANSIWLFDRRETVLFDFYNPYYTESGEYYYYAHNFLYWDLVYLYSVIYLFLALLYYLFFKGN